MLPHTETGHSPLRPLNLPPSAYCDQDGLDHVSQHTLVGSFCAQPTATQSRNPKVILNVHVGWEEIGILNLDPMQLLVKPWLQCRCLHLFSFLVEKQNCVTSSFPAMTPSTSPPKLQHHVFMLGVVSPCLKICKKTHDIQHHHLPHPPITSKKQRLETMQF
jgi:hypothetical protein